MQIIEIKKKEFQKIRLRKGYTLRSLADKANVGHITVFNLENQKTIPRVTTAKKICEALDVEFDEIFKIVDEEV